MKCRIHNKDVLAVCEWCGKELCRRCISKTNGKKAYCTDCAVKMEDFIKRKQVEKIQQEEKENEEASSQEYFNFSALKKT